jgi:MarR family transcriptional regulator, organic hydroperoxide resistance regulator
MSAEKTIIALLRRWREVGNTIDRATATVFADHGISETSAAVLISLGDTDTPQTMRDLARLLHCDPSNVTLVATRLADDGLIERQRHPTDGRSRVLVLTAKGHATRTGVLVELMAASPLSALSAAEQRRLLTLLGRIRC